MGRPVLETPPHSRDGACQADRSVGLAKFPEAPSN
jgi:hypothetical protein